MSVQISIKQATIYQKELTDKLTKMLNKPIEVIKSPITDIKNPAKVLFSNSVLSGVTKRRKCITQIDDNEIELDVPAYMRPCTYELDTSQKKYDLKRFDPHSSYYIVFKDDGLHSDNALALMNYYLKIKGYSYRIARLSSNIDYKLVKEVYLRLLNEIYQTNDIHAKLEIDKGALNKIAINDFYILYNPDEQDKLIYYYAFIGFNSSDSQVGIGFNNSDFQVGVDSTINIADDFKEKFALDDLQGSFKNRALDKMIKIQIIYTDDMKVDISASFKFNCQIDHEISNMLTKIVNAQLDHSYRSYVDLPVELQFSYILSNVYCEYASLSKNEINLPKAHDIKFSSYEITPDRVNKHEIDTSTIMSPDKNLTTLFDLIDPAYGHPRLFWDNGEIKILLGNTQLTHFYTFK